MIRYILLTPLFPAFVNPIPVNAQDTCYQVSWEFDAAYTCENGAYSSGGLMANEFSQATGGAFLTFSDEDDFFSSDGESGGGAFRNSRYIRIH